MQQDNTRLLVTLPDEMQAGMIGEILQDAGIPYIAKTPGPSVYNSALLYGVQIHVADADWERAKELVEGCVGTEE